MRVLRFLGLLLQRLFVLVGCVLLPLFGDTSTRATAVLVDELAAIPYLFGCLAGCAIFVARRELLRIDFVVFFTTLTSTSAITATGLLFQNLLQNPVRLLIHDLRLLEHLLALDADSLSDIVVLALDYRRMMRDPVVLVLLL